MLEGNTSMNPKMKSFRTPHKTFGNLGRLAIRRQLQLKEEQNGPYKQAGIWT
jgi:hypothetical protein